MRPIVLALLLWCLASSVQARDFLLERTILMHDAALGTQVIFLAKSGKTYLWHPSTTQIISGRWSTRASGTYPDTICLRYGGSDYNPVTGTDEQCTHVQKLLGKTVQQVQGDAFGLSGRSEAPFQLTSSRTTLSALADKAGVALTSSIIGDEGIVRPGGPAPTIDSYCTSIRQHQELFGPQDDTTRILERVCGGQ